MSAVLLAPQSASALCLLALPDNVTECQWEDFGLCCVVEEQREGLVCMIGVCIDFDICVEERVVALCFETEHAQPSLESMLDDTCRW